MNGQRAVDSDVVVRCCGLPGRLPVRPTCFFVNHASHRADQQACRFAGLGQPGPGKCSAVTFKVQLFHGAAVTVT